MAKLSFKYAQSVLQKVSFNKELFFKEVRKAIHYLLPKDLVKLQNWLQIYTSDKPELQPAISFINGSALFA
jgi:hypothetical protein